MESNQIVPPAPKKDAFFAIASAGLILCGFIALASGDDKGPLACWLGGAVMGTIGLFKRIHPVACAIAACLNALLFVGALVAGLAGISH